jgi:hypothetical protein
MDNFFFSRPEISGKSEFGQLFFHKDDEYFKWKKLQYYLFYNYPIPEYYNGKFNFIAYGTPLYGVVDGLLLSIPFPNDDRVKPELIPYFKDIWGRMNNDACNNTIRGISISELYDIFNLDNYMFEEINHKIEGGIIVYKNEHTFSKSW